MFQKKITINEINGIIPYCRIKLGNNNSLSQLAFCVFYFNCLCVECHVRNMFPSTRINNQ